MILYYSATGNSAYAAKRIGEAIGDEVRDLLPRLREGDHSPIHSEKPFVIVAPTFAWRLPRFVGDWLRKTELTGNPAVYFILTCGDSMANAGGYAQRLSQEMGKEYLGCASIVMPENYIAMFQAPGPKEAMEIVEHAEGRMDELADLLNRGERFPTEGNGPLARFCSCVVNPGFYALAIRDKKFFATEDCNGCGYCEKVCPLNNIKITDEKPRWSGNCTHCMACICTCPKEAIEYGKGTKNKVRYYCPKK